VSASRSWLGRSFVTALVGLAGALSAAPSFAADPVQFATLNGPCTTNGNTVYAAPVTSPHAHILMRYTVASGAAYLDSSVDSIAAGDVIWNPRTAGLNTNDPPSVYAFCDSPQTFTATFFDVPTTPTTFSGIGNDTTGSTVEFVAPGSGQYVADLSLSGGGVSMNVVDYQAFGHLTNFASSGQFVLGTMSAGTHDLEITALAGPRPTWTVRIYALPVAITDLTFGQPATRPGAFIQANYTTTGDTVITAVVRAANGQPVKTLASAFPVGEGGNSLSWDATTDAGVPLADGTYTLGITSLDPSGQTSAASTAIVIDGTPPSISVTSPSSIQADGAISGRISDALTGVASASVTARGVSDDLKAPSFVYRESGGFALGRHTIAISATDGAGNVRKLDYVFNVVSKQQYSASHTSTRAAPYLRCSRGNGRPGPARRRPTACLVFGPGGAFGGGVNLVGLRWTAWGAATVVGHGVEQGFHLPLAHTRVTVTLFRVRWCGPQRRYTRVRATSRFGTTVVRAIGCSPGSISPARRAAHS
jgi:hypothetical protein